MRASLLRSDTRQQERKRGHIWIWTVEALVGHLRDLVSAPAHSFLGRNFVTKATQYAPVPSSICFYYDGAILANVSYLFRFIVQYSNKTSRPTN